MQALAQVRPRKLASPDPLLLGAAFEACTEALAVVDRGRIVYANAAFARLLGPAGTSRLLGKTLAELGPECDSPLSSRLQTSSGKFSAQGRDLLVVSAHSVLPEANLAELRRAQKLEAVGRLVSSVAHDFNNLLTGVVLCCDLLLAKLGNNNPLRRCGGDEDRWRTRHHIDPATAGSRTAGSGRAYTGFLERRREQHAGPAGQVGWREH